MPQHDSLNQSHTFEVILRHAATPAPDFAFAHPGYGVPDSIFKQPRFI
jgi:hypothetical protein